MNTQNINIKTPEETMAYVQTEAARRLALEEREHRLTHPHLYCLHADDMWTEKEGRLVAKVRVCQCGKQEILDYTPKFKSPEERQVEIEATNSRVKEENSKYVS